MSVTPIFFDSFGHYSDPNQKYEVVNSTVVINSAGARSGALGAQFISSISSAAYVGKIISGLPSRVVAGVASRYATANNINRGIITFVDTTTIQVEIAVDPSGFIKAYRGGTGGTLLGTSASFVNLTNYNYFEANVFVDGSAGTVNVWVNGLLYLSLSGLNTNQSGTAQVTRVDAGSREGSLSIVPISIADFYIGTCTSSSDHLGDCSVLCRLPSANGTQNDYTSTFASYVNGTAYVVGQTIKDSNNNTQRCTTAGTASNASPTWATTGGSTTSVGGGCVFTVVGTGSNPGAANWMAVNESVPDDNSSYVTDATVNHQDRYSYPSVAGSQVFAVAVNLRAEKDDSGTRTIRAVTKSGATVADNGSDFALTMNAYADFQALFPTDPNSGVAWTVSGVNAAEFGTKTTA